MRTAFRLSAALAIALAACVARSAQESVTVREIRFENRGRGTLDEGFVRAHVRSRTGAELDRNSTARDVRSLLDTAQFTDVTVDVREATNGVALVFGLVTRPRMEGPIAIEGLKHFRDRKVREWLGLEPGDLVDDRVLGARSRRVLDEYRKDHWYDADIAWTIDTERAAPGGARVTLVVNEGAKAKVKRYRFEGNDSIGDRDLLDALAYPNWYNPFRWFKSIPYDADDLILYRTQVKDAYLNAGYLDVQVETPGVQADEGGRLRLAVRVTEGPLYRVGRIGASGIKLFPEGDVMAACKLRTGDVASMKAIDEASQALRDYYGSRGYVGTTARPALTPHPSNGVADVHFPVREGRLASVRNVVVQGNTRTKDKVIRREVLVYPGDRYDEVRARRSANRLRNLGYFSRVDTYPVDTPRDDLKDLYIEVEEKPTGQFMIGAAYSSDDNAIGFAEISQGNFDLFGWPHFTGGGQKLRLRAEIGSSKSEYSMAFTEPWFLDRRLSFMFDVYRSEVDYDDYDLKRTGFSTALAHPLPWNNKAEVRYRLERAEIDDTSDTNLYTVVDTGEPYDFTREESFLESSVALTLSHDTRDRPFLPTRGNDSSLAYTVAGGPFGCDVDSYRLTLNSRQHVSPWFKHVLSVRGRYDTIEAYGDTEEISIADRLFVGGARTLRGFEYRDVGPKAVRDNDTDYYRPIGGHSLAFASAEYSIPVVRFIRLATFFDIGNVWWDSYDIDLNDLASSAGLGIRFDIPGFPIRIDRAWVVESDDDLTDEDTWVFWIGM